MGAITENYPIFAKTCFASRFSTWALYRALYHALATWMRCTNGKNSANHGENESGGGAVVKREEKCTLKEDSLLALPSTSTAGIFLISHFWQFAISQESVTSNVPWNSTTQASAAHHGMPQTCWLKAPKWMSGPSVAPTSEVVSCGQCVWVCVWKKKTVTLVLLRGLLTDVALFDMQLYVIVQPLIFYY